jgi:hypothetical protein
MADKRLSRQTADRFIYLMTRQSLFLQDHQIEGLTKIINSLVSEDVRQSCKDGWHKEKNMWACDCSQCEEGRTEIATRYFVNFINSDYGGSEAEMMIAWNDWLDKEDK